MSDKLGEGGRGLHENTAALNLLLTLRILEFRAVEQECHEHDKCPFQAQEAEDEGRKLGMPLK
jgi:hypothetical protein